jgi:hypothetical protein
MAVALSLVALLALASTVPKQAWKIEPQIGPGGSFLGVATPGFQASDLLKGYRLAQKVRDKERGASVKWDDERTSTINIGHHHQILTESKYAAASKVGRREDGEARSVLEWHHALATFHLALQRHRVVAMHKQRGLTWRAQLEFTQMLAGEVGDVYAAKKAGRRRSAKSTADPRVALSTAIRRTHASTSRPLAQS